MNPYFSCNAEKKLIFLAFIMESAHCILMLAALGDHVEPHVNNGTGGYRLLHHSVTYYTQPCQRPTPRVHAEPRGNADMRAAKAWVARGWCPVAVVHIEGPRGDDSQESQEF